MSDPKATQVLHVKDNPYLLLGWLALGIVIIVLAAMGKMSVEAAALALGCLGFPSIVGAKTMPSLVQSMMTELNEQVQKELSRLGQDKSSGEILAETTQVKSTLNVSVTSVTPPPMVVPTAADAPTRTPDPLDLKKPNVPKPAPLPSFDSPPSSDGEPEPDTNPMMISSTKQTIAKGVPQEAGPESKPDTKPDIEPVSEDSMALTPKESVPSIPARASAAPKKA